VGGIFINYRREDTAHSAGRLYERLAREFPRNQLLMDVDAIEPGLDFVKVLDEQVSGCDVLLALIGPNWVDSKNERGVRRLDDPDDFVRIEIASALERDIRVIPILVDGAPMPRAEQLPEPLKPLARRNAVQVGHVRFSADTQGLVEVLRRITTQPKQRETSAVQRSAARTISAARGRVSEGVAHRTPPERVVAALLMLACALVVVIIWAIYLSIRH
jgi:TIR domain